MPSGAIRRVYISSMIRVIVSWSALAASNASAYACWQSMVAC